MTSGLRASYEGPKQAVDNCLAYRVETPNESKFYHGEIMRWLRHLAPATILLAGEKREVAPIIANEVGASLVETAGLVEADHIWDFNLGVPSIIRARHYDVVVTQAILEHIVNPYGFVSKLAHLTEPGGHLIIHTHTPGFPYHRFPVDCLRYFPDWFEEVARHFDLDVIDITTQAAHLFAVFRKVG